MKRILNTFLLVLFMLMMVINVYAQVEPSKNSILLEYGQFEVKDPPQGRKRIIMIKNNSDVDIRVRIKNEIDGASKKFKVGKRSSHVIDCVGTLVTVDPWKDGIDPLTLYKRNKSDILAEETPSVDEIGKEKTIAIKSDDVRHNVAEAEKRLFKSISQKVGTFDVKTVLGDFRQYVESVPFYSEISIADNTRLIDKHISCLENWNDKAAYIAEQHLNSYIRDTRDTLKMYDSNMAAFINNFIDKYGNRQFDDKDACIDSIQAILKIKLNQREDDLNRLSAAVNDEPETISEWGKLDWKIIVCGVIVLLFFVTVVFIAVRAKKRDSRLKNVKTNNYISHSDTSSAIVIRRKTTSILRKQSLEDVINNDAYLRIDCNDFCDNSAVRRIYIKNTCAKDIYNMYAEDLRNPNNPKEDGCMVLGRWVLDNETMEYYVSLEQIVMPGDDAVFAEYELNFGGKIKLKVTEKLRKLRRETNLQYDLTCWVHSHPGLGVFFSNSDTNVQMQLKHPSHPNFLTAIVVDILTPDQEFGIFTFKKDSTINSKTDLKKMYSLEELYKWAIESERNSFKADDYYNMQATAAMCTDECCGVELSNGAIIDMSMLAADKSNGFIGYAHGFVNVNGSKTENIVEKISQEESVPDNDRIGCFIITTHCSIPSIRKAVASMIDKIRFVLVYSTTDGVVTSIPVADNELCSDEKYYGEQKIEDLKIWTRRKR